MNVSYDEVLLRRLRERGRLQGVDLREGGSGRALPYPLPGPVAAFSMGKAQGAFLLGQEAPILREELLLRLAFPLKTPAGECRRIAREVVEEVMEADEEKKILTILMTTPEAALTQGVRRLDLTFGLRPMMTREVGA